MLSLASCHQRQVFSPPLGLGGVEAKFGNYSDDEVEALRASLARVAFPAEEGTAQSMLLRPVEPLNVSFSDDVPDKEGKGRMGGNVVEYWLNGRFVLQVASAYYKQDDQTFTKEEWAVVLTRSERDRFRRPIYPGDFGIIYVDQ